MGLAPHASHGHQVATAQGQVIREPTLLLSGRHGGVCRLLARRLQPMWSQPLFFERPDGGAPSPLTLALTLTLTLTLPLTLTLTLTQTTPTPTPTPSPGQAASRCGVRASTGGGCTRSSRSSPPSSPRTRRLGVGIGLGLGLGFGFGFGFGL